ncbi:tyrosine-protein kinase receptor Tie-1-like [Ptychodera flava]|uniref:tyrosine-protein kinase receptor Tie-1-like n=1 Tax=Ptychodera flava TaxID=63121 RepID=UPI003969D0E3
MEYFFQGSLDACLQDIRSSSTLDQRLTERELLSFALDITRGMEHLADLKIVHRYLSPKHVLVDSSLRCKISNFGYASGVIDDKSFYEKGKSSCPERWMAMESFLMTFTEKSDVWSFGVVLWQMASIGDTPYGLMTVDKIQGKLKNGYRLPKPASCGQIAYEEMIDCWKKDPSDRPAFSKLVKSLHALTDNVKEFMDISASRELAYSEVK